MSRTNFDALLEAGVHFGHLKRKWNPNMAPYIFMERNGIHIIDLYKTMAKVDEAASALKQITKSGKRVLFVATKKQAKEIVENQQIIYMVALARTSSKENEANIAREKLINSKIEGLLD